MTPHSSTLAWKIPWTEEPGRLQSMGSLRVRHDWMTSLSLFTFMHWRRNWQPTPAFLPRESQWRRSLVGCRLWGHEELDTTKATYQGVAMENTPSWWIKFRLLWGLSLAGIYDLTARLCCGHILRFPTHTHTRQEGRNQMGEHGTMIFHDFFPTQFSFWKMWDLKFRNIEES